MNPNSNSSLLESGLGKGIASGSTEELMATVDDLLLLAEVVEAGGIRATSARTGLTKSRLSRRIAALEERLHVCLLTRNSRHFEVTDVGRALYEHALQIRETARSAMTLANDTLSEPGGLLRVACPFALSRSVVAPLAIDFAIRHPRVRLCLATTKGTAQALEQHYDLLIHPSSQQLPDSDVVARRLSTVPYVLVASPALFNGLEVPKLPTELDRFPVVGWNTDDPVAAIHLNGPGGSTAEVRMPVRFSADNLLAVHEAALAGLGIARLPRPVCADDLTGARLVEVAPGWAPPPMSIYVIYSSRRQLSRAGHSFVELLHQHFQAGVGAR